jgi:hypothetical protein
MKLYDNAFSPFARKVRLVLDWKGLAYEATDGLDKANARALAAVNGRIEVPTLIDGDVTVSIPRTSSPTSSTPIPSGRSIRPIRQGGCGRAPGSAAPTQ